MNQILELQIEVGLLALDLTELNVFGGLTQLTTDLIAIFPGAESLPDRDPARDAGSPLLTPILDGRPGPAGQLANLELGHFQVDLAASSPATAAWNPSPKFLALRRAPGFI